MLNVQEQNLGLGLRVCNMHHLVQQTVQAVLNTLFRVH